MHNNDIIYTDQTPEYSRILYSKGETKTAMKTAKDAKQVVAKRKQAERQRRIAQILDAAKAVFIAKGYDKANLREIALEAELTTGAIYVYFKGKGELYGSVLEKILDREIAYLKQASALKASVPERLEALALAHLKFDADFPAESKLLSKNFDELNLSKNQRQRLDGKILKALSFIADVLQQGIQAGLFPADLDKREASFLIYSASEGIAYTTSYGHLTEFDFNREALVKKIVAYLISGMAR